VLNHRVISLLISRDQARAETIARLKAAVDSLRESGAFAAIHAQSFYRVAPPWEGPELTPHLH
jgi:hypothetical protein